MAILVVDDEPIFVKLLVFLLKDAGYQTLTAYDGPAALQVCAEQAPELVLLDIGMPHMSGFDVCRDIRRTSDVPIIFLSARSQAQDRVTGLQLGADDYLVKPCDTEDLLARIAAVLRRRSNEICPTPKRIRCGDLVLDPLEHTVVVRNQAPILLSPIEWRVLHYLAQNRGQVMSVDQIQSTVWGQDKQHASNLVAVYIRRLRDKLEPDRAQPHYLVTVPRVGYCFAR